MRTGLDDIDRGNWSFTPNALGEVVSQTDAKLQTTTFDYDKLGRLIERVEAEGTSTWTWGTSASANNIGRLASVSGPGYSESYQYDSVGRLKKRTINADTAYVYDFAYNNIGALHTLTYPTSTSSTRFKLRYYYNYGFPDRIRDYTGNSLGTTYWDLVSVDQRGQPIDVDLGNGVSVIAGFDALTGLIDYKQSGTGGSTTNIQDLVYDWDDNGNLSERRDDRQSLTETFFYDSMNRLDYSELGGTQNLDLAYQDNGNILNKDDVSGSNYGYHASKIHAVTSAGTNSFEYDANGNAKKRNGHTITWTSYNKPSDINGSGGQDSQFWYAPDRSRWKQVATYTSGTETTIYVGGLLEKRTVGSVTEYQHLIPAPDGTRIHRVLRTDSTTDTFYLATDHLGSTDAVLDATGGVEVYTSFDAFGQRRDPTDWDGPPSSSDLSKIADTTRRGYTGHEHLDNLGLIHMNGRVQDPLVGRFISADPYVPAPYYSQSLNRYSYVFNAPLTYTDPSGFDPDWRERGCIASDYCRRVYNDLRRRMHEPPWNLPPYPAPPGPTGDTDDQPDAPGPETGPPIDDSWLGWAPPVTATDNTFTNGLNPGDLTLFGGVGGSLTGSAFGRDLGFEASIAFGIGHGTEGIDAGVIVVFGHPTGDLPFAVNVGIDLFGGTVNSGLRGMEGSGEAINMIVGHVVATGLLTGDGREIGALVGRGISPIPVGVSITRTHTTTLTVRGAAQLIVSATLSTRRSLSDFMCAIDPQCQ